MFVTNLEDTLCTSSHGLQPDLLGLVVACVKACIHLCFQVLNNSFKALLWNRLQIGHKWSILQLIHNAQVFHELQWGTVVHQVKVIWHNCVDWFFGYNNDCGNVWRAIRWKIAIKSRKMSLIPKLCPAKCPFMCNKVCKTSEQAKATFALIDQVALVDEVVTYLEKHLVSKFKNHWKTNFYCEIFCKIIDTTSFPPPTFPPLHWQITFPQLNPLGSFRLL